MSSVSDHWGQTIARSTVNTVDAMKAAKLTPDEGRAILADVFADVIGQLEDGLLTGFRREVIAKLLAANATKVGHSR